MSVEIIHGWHLMCSPDLTRMRSDAMVSLIDVPAPPQAMLDYVKALEVAYLEHEFRQRRESCEAMWDQWERPDQ